MGTPKVAVLDDYQPVALQCADWSSVSADADIQTFPEFIADERALVSALADFEIVVAMRERTPFPRSLLAQLPALKLLITTGPSNASIDLGAAAEFGIMVCGTGAAFPPAFEHTWALILACAKRLVDNDHEIRSGGWQRHVGMDLAGARLGVMGLGYYGSRVATVGKAFDMDVVAWSQNLTDARCAEVGATRVEKDELLSTSDFVTIHLRLSDRTFRLIGERELRAMRSTAYLINTSRGTIIDEPALTRALQERWIAGAGLDVFEQEPLSVQHPFRQMQNVVCSPHVGYVTWDSYRIFFSDVVENIRNYLDGTTLSRVLT